MNAQLARPEGGRFCSFALQQIKAVPIGARRSCITAERTKTAVLKAVVREIQIAVHHVADRLASKRPAQRIGLRLETGRVRALQEGLGRPDGVGTAWV